MNILDENIALDEFEKHRKWRIPVRQIGYDIGHKGLQDPEIIPFLHRLRQPTLFTRDLDFYRRRLCHAQYCLVYLYVRPFEAAEYVHRVLRHPEFNTAAKRMGTVMRAAPAGLTVWRLHSEQESDMAWAE